jgi:hypothetical protein
MEMKFLRGSGIHQYYDPLKEEIEVKNYGAIKIKDAVFSEEFHEWLAQEIIGWRQKENNKNKLLAEKALCIINESLLPGERDIVITGQEKKKAKWKRKAGKMKRKRGEI